MQNRLPGNPSAELRLILPVGIVFHELGPFIEHRVTDLAVGKPSPEIVHGVEIPFFHKSPEALAAFLR